MTSEYKQPSLWGCITGTSKWSDYFNIPNTVSISWKRNSENGSTSPSNSTLSEKTKDHYTTSTSETKAREDKPQCSDCPGVVGEISNRKLAMCNEYFQPYCTSETVDNRNKLSKTYNQFVSENKSFQKSAAYVEHDAEIPTTENKICDLSEDENQHTAHTKTKQSDLLFKDSSKPDTESNTTVSRDKHVYSENWEENNGRTHQRTRKTGTERRKEVPEQVNKGDMHGGNKFREENEKKKSIRESWGKPTGATKKEMPDTDSEEPETTETKQISDSVYSTATGGQIDGSVLFYPIRTTAEVTEQEPPTESESDVDGSSGIHTSSESLPKLREHAAASVGNDTIKDPKEKSRRAAAEMAGQERPPEVREHSDSRLEYSKSEAKSKSLVASSSTAAMEIADGRQLAKVEKHVDINEPSERPKKKYQLTCVCIVDSPNKAMEMTERKCGTIEIPLEYLQGVSGARSSSSIASSKSSRADESTDEDPTKLEKNVHVGTARSPGYPHVESEVGISSSKRTVMVQTAQEHPDELADHIDDTISNYTPSEYPKDQSDLSSSLANSSGRETTSDDDGHFSDNTGSFTAENTSEDESTAKKSSPDRGESEEEDDDGSDMEVVLFTPYTPTPDELGRLSKTVTTSDESIKVAPRQKHTPRSAAPGATKREDKYTSVSSSSLRSLDSVKTKRSLIRQASEKILRVNKLVRFIIFKKPKHVGNNSNSLNYETRGNCDGHCHNISRSNSSLSRDPKPQREASLLKRRSKEHTFPEIKNEVNIAEEILGRTDMSNFQPKYQNQSYLYSVQENYNQTRFIPEINTETHNRSTNKKTKKVSFMLQFPVVQSKGCVNKLKDYSASFSDQNVLKSADSNLCSNVYSNTAEPFSIGETLCDDCRQN